MEHEYSLAIDLCKEIIKINPEYPKAYFNLGIIYKKRGNIDKAIENIEKGLSIDPNDKRAKAFLAELKS